MRLVYSPGKKNTAVWNGRFIMHSRVAAAGTAGLFIASWALASDEATQPKSDLPKSPEQYITTVSNKPPVVQSPHVDPAQRQPNEQDFYAPELRRAGLEGKAIVDVFVLADGTAGKLRIHHSSGATPLDAAAEALVAQMRFVPGTLNGTPSPMWARFAIGFKLDREEPEEPSAAAPSEGALSPPK
jgi:TonB family protein